MPSFEVLIPITAAYHWELGPFFHLFRRFWGEQQVTILSDSDPQVADTRFIPIRHTIGGTGWIDNFSTNLLTYLQHDCQVDFVVILMADYWLTKPVLTKGLEILVNFMQSSPQVIRLQISNGMDSMSSYIVADYAGMEIRDRGEFLRGSLIPGLWSKQLLLKYMQAGWSLWTTELELSRIINGNSELKSLMVMPEIITYDHPVKSSASKVDFSLFPVELTEEVRGFIPGGYDIRG